jgi:two-component system cell cycle response regulator DivK
VLKYLRERTGIKAPIVACTVHSSEMNNASKHGFNGFVGKPLDPDRFSEQVKRLLAGGPVWDLR